ncbi:MAG TPA: hypothetical protein VN855_00375 [Candidatus Acidoferrum sp.]|nr:hypothetical protein [Candidatus Acidoferrum sp.]
MLSNDTAKRLLIALTSQPAGNEVATALNNSQAAVAQAGWTMPAVIAATHNSATTDFGALKVGDYVVHIPAVAGNSDWAPVITAGTNPDGAGVIGDLYIVLRALPLPAASAIIL